MPRRSPLLAREGVVGGKLEGKEGAVTELEPEGAFSRAGRVGPAAEDNQP